MVVPAAGRHVTPALAVEPALEGDGHAPELRRARSMEAGVRWAPSRSPGAVMISVWRLTDGQRILVGPP
jgi:hypothetical protein